MSPKREASALRTVLAAIQGKSFAPVYYLYGDDDYLKDSAVRDLLDAALDPSTRDFNCEVRRASELDAEAVNDLLGTPPMFASRRAVVIRDVGALKKAARGQLEKYLEHPATDTLLLLVSPSGAKVDATMEQHATPLEFAPLSPDRVAQWIVHHASTVLNATVSRDAAHLLQQAVGNDLHLLAAELDKCTSYAMGARERDAADRGAEGANANKQTEVASTTELTIDVDAVAAVVGVRRGETLTDLLDAVARQDAAAAVQLVAHVMSQPKVTGVGIVISLSTQAFALAFGRARREAGVPTNRLPQEFFAYLKETGGYPGRPWGEAASAWTKHVEFWNTRACERALSLLYDADVALKNTTVSNAEQIIMSLVLALCANKTRTRKVA